MRKKIAAANWKMNTTLDEAKALLEKLHSFSPQLSDEKIAVFGIPFAYLLTATEMLGNKPWHFIAAKNCSDKTSGAYTGETSVAMLQSVGASFVILGHSERREYQQEGNALLAAKVDAVLAGGLTPIFCCGEPLDIREAGTQNSFVEKQLEESIFHLTEAQVQQLVIAYEPIWAIGTGKTATSEQAQEMHAHIRQVLAEKFGNSAAENVSILYGGSVNAANAAELFAQPDVDGGLVGGASLKPNDFLTIMNALQ